MSEENNNENIQQENQAQEEMLFSSLIISPAFNDYSDPITAWIY
jgi:hypothetical protein